MLTTARPRHRDLARNVTSFCRLLRDRGLLVTPGEVQDALRALAVVDLADREEFRLALRAVVTSKPEDFPIFDAAFEEFFAPRPPQEAEEQEEKNGATRESPDPRRMVQQLQYRITTASQSKSDEPDEEAEAPLYSPLETLAEKDFSLFRADELDEIARVVLQIARQLALQRSRRHEITRRGHLVDPRRTIRRNLKYGGTILELAKKRRKVRKHRIVLICDVSRSMDAYSRFLLQFIHALQNSLGKVESFVFATRLTRVTPYFKKGDLLEALDRISREVLDWSGGTRIGLSLRTFNEQYAPTMVNRRTIVILLSDGLDTGDPDLLREELEKLKQRAARLIWLNPLLGSAEYRPLARGMSAALPLVDVFAPAHNLASLMELRRHLT
jgi:uncharacterized protein with von Willebrand factor type A (vWA) domain